MPDRAHLHRVAWLTAAATLWVAATANAVPPSLRNLEDVHELGELFMRAVVSGDVGAGYRGLGGYWAKRAEDLAGAIVESGKRRVELRSRFGLSLGHELVAERKAGERAVRLTYFERFDRGGVVWHLVFIKPDNVWLVTDVSESEDLDELFGAP